MMLSIGFHLGDDLENRTSKYLHRLKDYKEDYRVVLFGSGSDGGKLQKLKDTLDNPRLEFYHYPDQLPSMFNKWGAIRRS